MQNTEFWSAYLTGPCRWNNNHYSKLGLFYATYANMRLRKSFISRQFNATALVFFFITFPGLLGKHFSGSCYNESCLSHQGFWAPMKGIAHSLFSLKVFNSHENVSPGWGWAVFLFLINAKTRKLQPSLPCVPLHWPSSSKPVIRSGSIFLEQPRY